MINMFLFGLQAGDGWLLWVQNVGAAGGFCLAWFQPFDPTTCVAIQLGLMLCSLAAVSDNGEI